jgi:hypothetical protein
MQHLSLHLRPFGRHCGRHCDRGDTVDGFKVVMSVLAKLKNAVEMRMNFGDRSAQKSGAADQAIGAGKCVQNAVVKLIY